MTASTTSWRTRVWLGRPVINDRSRFNLALNEGTMAYYAATLFDTP
jgi:hypothetical protein